MKINQPQKNNHSDWQQVKFEDCFENKGGSSLEEYVESKGLYRFISIGNYSVGGRYIDNGQRIIKNTKTTEKILNKGDLVMVLNDKTTSGDLIGSTILIDTNDSYIYNQRSERLIPGENILPEYAWHLLNSEFRKKIFDISQGGTQIYVNFPSVKRISFNLPPLPEQNRIVSVLETWDKSIEKLAQKIEVKKQIKKGLMQDLLTGKKRLSGFSDKWESHEFLELFDVLKKPFGFKSEEYKDYGSVPIVDQSYHKLISGYTNEIAHSFDFTRNAVIVFGDHSRVIKYIDQKVAFGNDGIKLFQAKNNLNIRFGYYLLCKYRIPETGYNRHYKYLENAVFDVPDIKEQKEIANILTTADEEITTLQHKLSILKDQKKYLLNNLITGTIRTPETLSAKLTK